MKIKKYLNILFLLFLSVLILIFFSKYLSGENLFFATDEAASDLLDFYYPQRDYLAEHLKNNQIPLWNPYEQSGFPFLAEAQTGVFYPINLILFKFLPTPLAFNWSIIISFFILSFGMYFFLKNLGLSRLSSFFGASIISFSGFYIGHLKHIPILQSASFLPWILMLIDKLTISYNKKYLVPLSLVFALCILPGHFPTSYSVVIISVAYFLIRATQTSKTRGEAITPIFVFFASLTIGLLLSAIQLLPTVEMFRYSTRTIPISASGESSLSLKILVTFLVPFFYGDPSRSFFVSGMPNFWEITGYIGIIPLIFSIYALFSKSGKSLPFKVLFFIGIVLVLGYPKELFESLWNFLPGLIFTRIPSRYMLFVDFSLVVLASFTIDKILQNKKFEEKLLAFLLIIFSVADLVYNFYGYYGKIPADAWINISEPIKFLQKNLKGSRIANFGQDISYQYLSGLTGGWRGNLESYILGRSTLPPTLNSLFKIPSLHFQYEYAGSFSLARNSQLSVLSQGQGFYVKQAPKLLGLENVKYVVTMIPVPEEMTTLYKKVKTFVFGGNLPDLTILENQHALSRAYLVPQAAVKPVGQILSFMASDDFDPKKQVVLEENTELLDSSAAKGTDSVNITADQETKINIDVVSANSSYLVLTDSYYPGWHATVDGKETKILKANYAFKAIAISPGNHKVEFYFQPKSYYVGRIITLAALTSLAVVFIVIL